MNEAYKAYKDLISVIIPVYNTEKFIRKCLDSILKQTYELLEILLVDDGSTDNSGKICDQYGVKDERIQVIHKENGGAALARNAGLEQATGKYIMFVDSDDWVEHNIIEMLYLMLDDDKYDVAVCQMDGIGDAQKEYGVRYGASKPEDLLKPPSPVAKLFRKTTIGELRFKNYKLEEDLLFLVDLLCQNPNVRVTYSKETLYHYYMNGTSLTHGELDEDVFAGLELEVECYERLKKNGISVKNVNLITSALFRVLQKYSMLSNDKKQEMQLYYRECLCCARKYRRNFVRDNSFSFVMNISRIMLYFFPQIYIRLFSVKERMLQKMEVS